MLQVFLDLPTVAEMSAAKDLKKFLDKHNPRAYRLVRHCPESPLYKHACHASNRSNCCQCAQLQQPLHLCSLWEVNHCLGHLHKCQMHCHGSAAAAAVLTYCYLRLLFRVCMLMHDRVHQTCFSRCGGCCPPAVCILCNCSQRT